MPVDFTILRPAVVDVLKAWYRVDFPLDAWANMIYLVERFQSHPTRTAPESRRAHIKTTIEQALKKLAESNKQAEQLLRTRYLSPPTRSPARRADLATRYGKEPRVKHLLDQACNALAQELTRMEEKACRRRTTRIAARLPTSRPPTLFGQTEHHARALAALRAPDQHALIAIEGLGGIGKTSLANALLHALLLQPDFLDLFWISAQQKYFSPPAGAQTRAARPEALTHAQLIVELADALDLSASASTDKLQALVQAKLKAQPYLIVLDNLETLQDYRALLPTLHQLAGPTKFLLTSRESVGGGLEEIYPIRLHELGEADLLTLVRQNAAERGLHELATETDETLHAIYAVTGGHPLAAKLIVGQAHERDLDLLIAELREATSPNADSLFDFIYRRSWDALSPAGRDLLLALATVGTKGVRLNYFTDATELPPSEIRKALSELTRYALVEIKGTVNARRYGIHQLTATFLLGEVRKWM